MDPFSAGASFEQRCAGRCSVRVLRCGTKAGSCSSRSYATLERTSRSFRRSRSPTVSSTTSRRRHGCRLRRCRSTSACCRRCVSSVGACRSTPIGPLDSASGPSSIPPSGRGSASCLTRWLHDTAGSSCGERSSRRADRRRGRASSDRASVNSTRRRRSADDPRAGSSCEFLWCTRSAGRCRGLAAQPLSKTELSERAEST